MDRKQSQRELLNDIHDVALWGMVGSPTEATRACEIIHSAVRIGAVTLATDEKEHIQQAGIVPRSD